MDNNNETKGVDSILMSTLLSLGVPVERLRFTGKADTYITFQLLNGRGDSYADDDETAREHYYGAELYSKGNYIALLSEIRTKLKAAGFYGISISAETYERDTGFNHVSFDFYYMEDLEE